MEIWDFGHPHRTGNVLLCWCKERYLLSMKCFIAFLRCVKMVKGAFDRIYEPLMIHNMLFLPTTNLKFHPKFQFSGILSTKGMWCCATRRDIHCCLTTSYHSLNVLGWLEELPVAYMSLLWGTQHVISASNKYQISCKVGILSTLSAQEMCCCATRRGIYCWWSVSYPSSYG